MSGWQDRIGHGVTFEKKVQAELTRRGWVTAPFGQSLLDRELVVCLRDVRPPTLVRWLPDLVATTLRDGIRHAVYLDAKGSADETWRKTGNHCVERLAAQSLVAWESFSRSRAYFAFGDASICRPQKVLDMGRAGQFNGAGSGTDFLLIDRTICDHFNAVFGEPIGRAA